MSRVCRSVNDDPSVTTYCRVSTFVVSLVGKYTSLSTPPATVNQTFEVRLRAVPTQSLRARSKCDRAPGPSVAAPACGTGATVGDDEDRPWRAAAVVTDPKSATTTTAPANRPRPLMCLLPHPAASVPV